MIEGEYTEARDPLKTVQHLTAAEGCSGNDKRYNYKFVTLYKQFIKIGSLLQVNDVWCW